MRYLGLDLGSVTCGVALSLTGMIAETYCTVRFKPDDYDTCLDRILEIAAKEKPDEIVLGLPLHMNGDLGERGQICMEFGRVLEEESGIKVVMRDERLTTVAAEQILLEADVSRKKRKKVIDQMAAVQILQGYLDTK